MSIRSPGAQPGRAPAASVPTAMQLDVPQLSGALAILSAMITPAVLISACGSLIIATSTRLGRVIDRTRQVSDRFAALAREEDRTMLDEERALIFDQLNGLTRRTNLLQRAMSRLYLAVSLFVGTSVAIGLVAAFGQHWAYAPVVLGLIGALLLLSACLSLIVESRIAVASIKDEMEFVRLLGQRNAPTSLLERGARRGIFGRRRE